MFNDFELFRDVWLFWKKFKTVGESDEYWDTLSSEAQQLGDNYNSNQFAIDLILAVVGQLERMAKYNKKGE